MEIEDFKNYDFNLTNDAVFKHYFSVASNLSVLLSLILDEEIHPEDITYLPNEVIITPKIKKPRFDLKILIQNELNIDLEMQNTKENYFIERAFHYLASMVMRNNKEGNDYNCLDSFLCIWLMNTKQPVFDNNSYCEIYSMSSEITNNRIDKYRILIIDLKKLNLCDNIELREYLSMIESKSNITRNLNSSNELIKKEAKKMKDYLESNESFRIALETLKSELDYNSAIKSAKEEGLEQGLEQGIEQGLERGITQKQEEVIFKLYQKGKSVEEIADLLDLSIDEVRKILGK